MTAKLQENIARWGYNTQELDDLDAWSSEWDIVKKAGGVWGGRSRGGRGVRVTTGITPNISVDGVTLQFAGKSLLSNASLRFQRGHIYGLVGPNGIGKSTLLRRFAKQCIPGVPVHLKVVYLQQEIPCCENTNITVMDFIKRHIGIDSGNLGSIREGLSEAEINEALRDLKSEEARLESLLTGNTDNEADLEEITNQLCDIGDQIDALTSETVGSSDQQPLIPVSKSTGEEIAAIISNWPAPIKTILGGLGIINNKSKVSSKVLGKRMSELSGGWRLRVALALVLVATSKECGNGDVLLMDEPTNHLDLPTIVWLQRYLTTNCDHLICIVVSHDRSFLDYVCSDIAEMKDEAIKYFPDGYSQWERNQNEIETYHNNKLDAQARKEEHLRKSIEHLKSRGKEHNDVSAASAAKSKEKKLERASMHRCLDGKKFKLFSIKKMDMDYLRHPQYIQAIRKNKTLHFKFPSPMGVGLSPSAAVISLDDCSISWKSAAGDVPPVLSGVSLAIGMNSRIAIVGPNGQGKSTLLTALLSELSYSPHLTTKRPVPDSSSAADSEPTPTPAPAPSSTSSSSSSSQPLKPPSPPAAPLGGTVTSFSSKKLAAKKLASASRDDDVGDVFLRGGVVVRGSCFAYHNLRVAVVSQHHIDAMSDHLLLSAMTYCSSLLQAMVAQSISLGFSGHESLKMTDLEMRAHLGNFGLSGDIVLKPIGSYSGGQKTRLAFAAVCLFKPHVLLLDEPTNNLSMDAINALALACQEFEGAVVLVSHNIDFLCQVCKELVVVDNGTVSVKKSVADVLKPPVKPAVDVKNRGSKAKPSATAVVGVPTIGEETFSDILEAYITTQIDSL